MKGKEKSYTGLPETNKETQTERSYNDKSENSGKKKSFVIIPVILIILIFALVGLAFYLLSDIGESLVSYTFEKDGFQYYAGAISRVETGKTIASKEGPETANLQDAETIVNLPVYFEDDEVFFPESGIYYPITSPDPVRLDYFSSIAIENSGLVLINGDTKLNVQRGFVFDGEDMYFFAEPVTLCFNGVETKLGIFSYVEADYDNGLMIYNAADGECELVSSVGTVTAKAVDGSYELSLIADSVSYKNGDKELLFTRSDLLNSVFETK